MIINPLVKMSAIVVIAEILAMIRGAPIVRFNRRLRLPEMLVVSITVALL